MQEAQVKFYEIAQLPGIVSAIDGTHVGLHCSKLGPDEHVFVNRKGKYSINVQLACSADFKLTSVLASFPGSNHDSHILRVNEILHVTE